MWIENSIIDVKFPLSIRESSSSNHCILVKSNKRITDERFPFFQWAANFVPGLFLRSELSPTTVST